MNQSINKPIFSILATFALIACGGGGDSGGPGGGNGGGGGEQPTTYTVSTSVGDGGSINPTSASVTSGETTAFTLTPDERYGIDSVSGCGGSLDGDTYTTGSITSNCTVTASFAELPEFQVKASVEGRGTISPKALTLLEGQAARFELQADSRARIESVTGCNGTLDGTTYTVAKVTSECEVTAVFVEDMVTVSVNIVTGAEGGTVEGDASQTIYRGDTPLFALLLQDDFWSVSKVEGCVKPLSWQDPQDINRKVVAADAAKEDCTLNISLTPPSDSEKFVELPFDILMGKHNLASKTVEYGSTVTLTLEAFGDRSLVAKGVRPLNPGVAELCAQAKWEGATVTLTDVNGQCEVWADFRSPDEYNFADRNLQRVFHFKSVLFPDRLMTAQDVAGVQSISVSASVQGPVTDLSGIEAATSLKELSIANFVVTDLGPLRNLGLRKLSLKAPNAYAAGPAATSHVIDSLAPITTLPLEYLRLVAMHPADGDYAVLRQLADLTSLEFSRTESLTDISFIEDMMNLKNLSLLQTGVVDLQPVLNSSLPAPGNDLTHWGCVVETSRVMAELKKSSQELGWSFSYSDTGEPRCASIDGRYAIDASVALNSDTVSMDINFIRGQLDDYMQCHIYYGRVDEQLRNPDVTLDNCGSNGTATIPRYFDAYDIEIWADDGRHLPVRVAETRVADENIDRSQPRLVDTQWGQVVLKSRPSLVPGREAVFRAHIIADGGVEAPGVALELQLGAETKVVQMTAPDGNLPARPDYIEMNESYVAEIPAEWMQDGLQLKLQSGDKTIYAETPFFDEQHTLYLSMVPVFVNGVEVTIDETDKGLRDHLLRYFPLYDVVIRREDPIVIETEGDVGPGDVAAAIVDRRELDGGLHYYHGVFPGAAMTVDTNISGLAYSAFKVAVTQVESLSGTTFPHEVGHTFDLRHINCNLDNGDYDYPYDSNTIGSHGYMAGQPLALDKDQYAELMSYCAPKHISDYSYELVQDFFSIDPPASFDNVDAGAMNYAAAKGQPGYSTLITGTLDVLDGEVYLRLVRTVNRPAGLEKRGDYTLVATDDNGNSHSRSFAVDTPEDAAGLANGYFAVQLPVNASSLVSIRILHKGEEIFSQRL